MALTEIEGSVLLIGDESIVSKSLFTFKLPNTLVATFNVNTAISTPQFSGTNTLKLSVKSENDLHGFVAFSGVIGEGRIKVTMKNGAKTEGGIEGGPKKVQSIVGFGTWLRS